MTFGRALDLRAHVSKGEEGSLVVYDDKIIRTETDAATGEEAERAIAFMRADRRRPGRGGLSDRAVSKPDTIILDGRGYSWQQLEA